MSESESESDSKPIVTHGLEPSSQKGSIFSFSDQFQSDTDTVEKESNARRREKASSLA